MYVAAAPFWYTALRRVQRLLHTKLVPLLAVFSAFCFVIMMFNLPLPGGTTGHAVGMGIATIVLGPWGSILAISIALADPGDLLWRWRRNRLWRELLQYGDCRLRRD